MWREILTYNSSVLVLNVEINDHVVVHLSDFIFEPESKSFVVITQKKQTIQSLKTHNGTNRISCLGCKVILDHNCGIFLPYFIVQDSKQCYLFCLDANNQWLMRYHFTIPEVLEKHIELCDTSYSIENGPTLIWTVRDEIFIYKAEYSLGLKRHVDDILRVPIDFNCDKGLEVASNILWWKSGDSEQGMIVVKDSKGTIVNSYLITIDNEKRKANIVLNRQIIPFPYLVITLSTLVHPEHLSANESDLNDNSYRVFISTTQSQLLEFSHGHYVKHINIPFSSCQNIQIFESPKGDLILLCFEEDQVCAVDWINSKILRIFQVSSNVLLLDDFIGLGTFQILLLYGLKHESPQIFDKFMLTDFCKIDLEKSKENKKSDGLSTSRCTDVKRGSVESCVDNVVNALMRKVQATEVSITECKMEKSEKSSFVKRHCETLCNMLVNEITSPVLQISGLAQLVTGQETSSKELRVQHSKIIARSKWQEMTSSEWIIGVEVENVGQRAVSNISLCTVNKASGILVSSSKILRSEMQIRKQENQMLSSGRRATLVAIISLPSFSFENHFITVSLMLTWKHEENNEYLSQFCGQMTLRMEDIINSARRNCQHVALYPLKTQVVVSIASCDINKVIELLKSNMKTCERSSSQKYHLRYPLATTHVSWTCAKKALVMDIFTRDYNELCLCLRLLRQRLPDNLSWSLFGNKLALEFAISSIKNEISCRIDELNNLLKAQTTVRSDGTEDSLPVEESEEISVKRRKISQYKHSVHSYSNRIVDSTRKTFLHNFSYPCNTDNVVLTLLFHQNKSE